MGRPTVYIFDSDDEVEFLSDQDIDFKLLTFLVNFGFFPYHFEAEIVPVSRYMVHGKYRFFVQIFQNMNPDFIR